jgi:hypothetical protein
MAVPSSGTISLAGIKNEVDEDNYNAGEEYTSISLTALAAETTFNTNSDSVPNSSTPHGMSEWYGYDHDAVASFANAKAVSKTISTGTSNAITFTDSSDTFNFTENEAWTISFWIKVGWNSSLNTNIHFVVGHKSGTAYQLEDGIKILYNESNNRIQVRYGNKPNGSTVWYKDGQWLFHSNSGAYAAGYAAAGLGGTYWSATNRGYVNSDNYTMITITKAATNLASSLKLYWNANAAGSAPIQANAGTSKIAANPMSATDNRLWSLGSRGDYGSVDQDKAGNSSATLYNDVTMWNKELSASEVTSLYNSGTVMDATTHSAQSNLIGYWKFEGNGNPTRSNISFTISGGSAIVNK